MRLIQKYLPDPRHREINRIFVQAKPETAWNVARHFDAAKVPWVRLLFDIRAIPDYLRGNPRASDFQLGPPLHGIMESEQLRNIKRLAERDALLR